MGQKAKGKQEKRKKKTQLLQTMLPQSVTEGSFSERNGNIVETGPRGKSQTLKQMRTETNSRPGAFKA